MFKKIIIIILTGLILATCSNQIEKKGKKGDFLFRKCTKCVLKDK